MFNKDFSDGLSALHCLKNNVSPPSHILSAFDLDKSNYSGMESEDNNKGLIAKIIDKIKVSWNLDIQDTTSLILGNIAKLEKIKSEIESRKFDLSSDKIIELLLTKETAIQPLLFLDKEINYESIISLINSSLKINIKPSDIFNILKVDYENIDKNSKYKELTKEGKQQIIKESEKIKNSNFLDAKIMKQNLVKNKKLIGSESSAALNKKGRYYNWSNSDNELLIPLCVDNKEAVCILKDNIDRFITIHNITFSFTKEELERRLNSNASKWNKNKILDFTDILIKLIESYIKKFKDSINVFKNLSADSIFMDMYNSEDEEVFLSIQYVLSTGYKNLSTVMFNLCSSLNKIQNELYNLSKK